MQAPREQRRRQPVDANRRERARPHERRCNDAHHIRKLRERVLAAHREHGLQNRPERRAQRRHCLSRVLPQRGLGRLEGEWRLQPVGDGRWQRRDGAASRAHGRHGRSLLPRLSGAHLGCRPRHESRRARFPARMDMAAGKRWGHGWNDRLLLRPRGCPDVAHPEVLRARRASALPEPRWIVRWLDERTRRDVCLRLNRPRLVASRGCHLQRRVRRRLHRGLRHDDQAGEHLEEKLLPGRKRHARRHGHGRLWRLWHVRFRRERINACRRRCGLLPNGARGIGVAHRRRPRKTGIHLRRHRGRVNVGHARNGERPGGASFLPHEHLRGALRRQRGHPRADGRSGYALPHRSTTCRLHVRATGLFLRGVEHRT